MTRFQANGARLAWPNLDSGSDLARTLLLGVLLAAATSLSGAERPFRTDDSNAHLPWYQPKPLEFPPHHSDRRIGGELVSADFIHRSGQFEGRRLTTRRVALKPEDHRGGRLTQAPILRLTSDQMTEGRAI